MRWFMFFNVCYVLCWKTWKTCFTEKHLDPITFLQLETFAVVREVNLELCASFFIWMGIWLGKQLKEVILSFGSIVKVLIMISYSSFTMWKYEIGPARGVSRFVSWYSRLCFGNSSPRLKVPFNPISNEAKIITRIGHLNGSWDLILKTAPPARLPSNCEHVLSVSILFSFWTIWGYLPPLRSPWQIWMITTWKFLTSAQGSNRGGSLPSMCRDYRRFLSVVARIMRFCSVRNVSSLWSIGGEMPRSVSYSPGRFLLRYMARYKFAMWVQF